ncbi:GNAT family N-acetyltransferase [Micromonospora robiginosa]|uniref:GNAT family N-acetyltransferase n=1 Tax=Micromonospora robiginosa TaxID=2749844 RepID=A0A7L6BE72_9ACTN|nr:GNAT family N-acetyltransferase [Micromonospora ferruginea]QLQ40198.1 GNAT family N-acetyltransferase [Micromonospora ferruginea]
MRLEKVTPDNYEAALALSVRPDQDDLVAPVVKSLAEAYVFPEHAWPRLVYDGDRLVGFLMAFFDIAWNDDPDDVRAGLWRLNIAADTQGRGYGRYAVEAVCEEIRSRGGDRAYVTWEPRPGGPEEFYLKLGFRPTGEQSGGQTVAVRDLQTGPRCRPGLA